MKLQHGMKGDDDDDDDDRADDAGRRGIVCVLASFISLWFFSELTDIITSVLNVLGCLGFHAGCVLSCVF